VDPATQLYPAEQGPLQDGDERPLTAPKVPAGQGPLQDALGRADVAPKLPAGHAVQLPAPPTLYCPAGHADAVDDVDPATHAYPAEQGPLQDGDDRPLTAPKVPAGHAVQLPAPPTLYCPAGHAAAVDDADPATHAYPAEQGPLQDALDRPLTAPKVPAGHGEVQAALVSPVVLPYRPAPQSVQAPAPPTLNLPAAHTAAVALVDPATHAYPAEQGPLQDGDDRPLTAPKVPAGHAVQLPAPPTLNCPAGHADAVDDVDPATHASTAGWG
jgi:heat shock protein HspQ